MPSLAAGTNWTFNGRLVVYPGSEPNCINASVPFKLIVVVSSAGALSTTFTGWNGSGLNTNLKQQSVVLSVTSSSGSSKPSTVNYYGLFEEGDFGFGQGIFYSVDGDFINLEVVSSDSVCDGKQAAKAKYTGPGQVYSTIMGYVCRNNSLV